METLGIVGVDFFQAVVDETSGACRSSEEPSVVHDANSDEDGGGDEKKKRAGTRCGRSQRHNWLSWLYKCHLSHPCHVFSFMLSYLSS
jgi:hypothetical protein